MSPLRTVLLAALLAASSGCAPTSPRVGMERSGLERRDRDTATARLRIPASDSTVFPTEPSRKSSVENRKSIDSSAVRSDTPESDSTALLRVISDFLGLPYRRGGTTEMGMDCSAFTRSVFSRALAIALPRSTGEQYKTGKPVGKADIAVGDLVFFNTGGRRPSHVGIYIGNGMFAHASVNEGVTLSDISSRYYARRYIGARRILKNSRF